MRITPLMMTSLGQQLSMERRIKYPNRSIHQIRSAFSPQPDHIRTRQCVLFKGLARQPRTSTTNQIAQQTTHSTRHQNKPADLGENTRFVTPEQNGPYCDEIVIDCQKINDRPFRGTITFNEAMDKIFIKIIGFNSVTSTP